MTNTSIVTSILSIGCLHTALHVSAFVGSSAFSHTAKKSLLPLCCAETTTEVNHAAEEAVEQQSTEDASCWAQHALLFSSLSDGVIPNTGARSFLRYSLVSSLLRDYISQKEKCLKSSVEFSPCNGPNVDVLNNLESVDELYNRGQKYSSEDFDTNNDNDEVYSWADESLQYLMSDATKSNIDAVNIRVLYIPTAMYALNPQSSNTPGKQRQRARADGKKRRTQLLNLLGELLSSNNDDENRSKINLLATTLDLDDGSLKQPVGSDDTTLFPKNDRDALSTWHPHLIYVEGGNTFWLQHCIEKGGYSKLIKDTCASSGTVYCGKSAGAIVAGQRVATATWKGWDDPSVVNGKETYDDWIECDGFGFVGDFSFFPHMSDDWKELVEEKVNTQNLGKSVYCLREEDACCVIGDKKLSFITSGPTPIN